MEGGAPVSLTPCHPHAYASFMGLKGILEKMKLVESDEPAAEADVTAVRAVPSSTAPRRPATPSAPPPSMKELIHRVPPPRLDEQSLSGSQDIPDFPSIYKASGVKDPAHGFTAYKVLEILSSPDFAALDARAKAAALSGFLRMNPAGPVPIEDVIEEMELESQYDILGLFQGVGITETQESDPVPREPNMVFLYRRPILDEWSDSEITLGDIVTHVLVHEIGHHFGFSDADMERIEAELA